jgi:hypothetical protein
MVVTGCRTSKEGPLGSACGLVCHPNGSAARGHRSFGDPDGRPTNPITNLHDAGVIVGPLGIVLLIFALVSTGRARARSTPWS